MDRYERSGSTLVACPIAGSGRQFSHDPEALNQYFRQMVPDTGPFDAMQRAQHDARALRGENEADEDSHRRARFRAPRASAAAPLRDVATTESIRSEPQ